MRCIVTLFVCCVCLSGQPAPQGARDLALTRTSDAGIVTIHLRNPYPAPATAWILQCETPQGGSRYHWNDQELALDPKPLDPGQDIQFRIPRRPTDTGGTCEDFHLIAAVFSDGTVSGDLRWIDAIVQSRRRAHQNIAKAIDILTNAHDGAAAIQQLTEWRQSTTGVVMARRPFLNRNITNGWTSKGTAPPALFFDDDMVASASLWLIDDQKKSPADSIAELTAWRDRLARLQPVAEPGARPAPASRTSLTGPSTPPSDPALTGKPAPDFTLKDVDGREVALKSLRGKTVLLDFWATWCGPCREETPHIKQLYDEFKDKDFVVVSIDVNEPAKKPKKYFEEKKLPFLNLLDAGRDVAPKYGGGGIPRVVLIDKDGIVRYFHRGWGSGMNFRPEVQKLLN